jgi:expansin (peptidoglycan-binding protein)
LFDKLQLFLRYWSENDMAFRKQIALLMLGFVAVAVSTIAAQPQINVTSGQRTFLPLVMGVAETTTGNPIHTGQATYYNEADGSGNCSFDPTPSDLMIGAMNHTDYASAALCGAFVEVTGPKGVVNVRIVDRCPECPAGNIDLSPQAFAKIADLVAGRVPITWRIISPDINGPIKYRFKEGSNQWWTAVQVRNHRNPITKFEYRNAAGQWVVVQRMEYNYFVETNGMGPGPYTFRVTDIYGNMLIDQGIPHMDAGEVTGSGQFPKQP